MRRRSAAVLAVAALTTTLLPGPTLTAAAVTAPAKPYDLNGDGYPELVIGSPWQPVDGVERAGGFAVLRGTRTSVSRSTQVVSRATAGVPGEPAEDDVLGQAVASADFDRDGYADLVVAAEGGASAADQAASLLLVPGSRRGLDLARTTVVPRPPDAAAARNSWAGTLATGDLDGDGHPDLAVGSYSEGLVRVFRGGAAGLAATPFVVLHNPADQFGFGSSLATGDVDGDGVADLAVVSQGVQVNDWGRPGAVSLCRGSRSTGPTGCRLLESGYQLANLSSVAIGNVTGGVRAEIVAGDAGWDDDDAGAVHVLRLTGHGSAVSADDLVLTQASKGVPGADEARDEFGATVRLADLDRDGWEDLVIAAPGENDEAGRVTVVHGARTGLATRGNATLDLNTRGVPGRARGGQRFGADLALLDHDADGRVDLDVAVPGRTSRGELTTLEGVRGGFTSRGARTAQVRGLLAPTSVSRWVLGTP